MEDSPTPPPAVRPLVSLVPPEERGVHDVPSSRESRGAILPTPTSEPIPLIGIPPTSSAAISPRGSVSSQQSGMGSQPPTSKPPNVPVSAHYAKNVPPRFQKQSGPNENAPSQPHMSSYGPSSGPALSPGNNVNAANSGLRDERESNYPSYPGRGHSHNHPPHQQQGYGNFHGPSHPGSSMYQPVSPEPLDNYTSGDRDHYRDYDPSPPEKQQQAPPPPRHQEQQEPPEIGEWRGTTNSAIVGLMDNQQMNSHRFDNDIF